jgi:hypothetical protein
MLGARARLGSWLPARLARSTFDGRGGGNGGGRLCAAMVTARFRPCWVHAGEIHWALVRMIAT